MLDRTIDPVIDSREGFDESEETAYGWDMIEGGEEE